MKGWFRRMAELVIVAVKDRAMDAFMRPFFVPHRAMAVRSFVDELNRAESEMVKHPDDYDLYSLGVWNEMTGNFNEINQAPELLVRGKDCVRKTNGS